MAFYEIDSELYNLETIQSFDYNEDTERLKIAFSEGYLTQVNLPFTKKQWGKLKKDLKKNN